MTLSSVISLSLSSVSSFSRPSIISFSSFQVVKSAVIRAMENPSKEHLLLGLLKEATEENLITRSQVGTWLDKEPGIQLSPAQRTQAE